MARKSSSSPAAPRGRRRFERNRPRKYTQLTVADIDYKDLSLLRRFVSDRGKIRPRCVTGLSRRHQRQLAISVKRARELALMPYVGDH